MIIPYLQPHVFSTSKTSLTVQQDTSMYGEKSVRNSSAKLDLPMTVEDFHKSRRELGVYVEKRRYLESVKERAEMELSEAKKSVEELTLLIERSNCGVRVEENGNHAEGMRDLVAMKKELSKLKIDVDYVLRERVIAEKEVEELWFKTKKNLRLLESLKKEIEVVNEERFLVELGKTEALDECKEIERWKESKGKEVLDLLAEKNKRIEEMLEEAERSKNVENELFETTSDIEMLETQLKLVKKMKRRDKSMLRSNSLSVLKEVIEAKKREFASVKAELFEIMASIDMLRNEIIQAKEETAWSDKSLRKYDVTIQKRNSKMLMAKSKLEIVLSAKERISSLADNLVRSLEKLKRKRESAKKEEGFLKDEKMVTKAETEKTKLEIDEKERELMSKLDELKKAKDIEDLVLENLESLIENTMETRETESEHCSTITISMFEYKYLSRHASLAEEAAGKKVVAAEAWAEAIKASTRAVSIKTEALRKQLF